MGNETWCVRPPWVRGAVLLAFCVVLSGVARADIPKELYSGLAIKPDASPRELHEALTKRYRDPAQGAGKGKFAHLWQPIPFSKYFDPLTFYEPPSTPQLEAGRKECVDCHTALNPGLVQAWKKSGHSESNLARIRALKPTDPRFYKRAQLEEVEKNLRSLGKLGAGQKLKEVGCIDCHVDVNTTKTAHHAKDLRMPTADVCGACHLQQFAERESERDTAVWPNDQWPKGRPSHALDYRANVETGIWAGMAQREIAEGCTACHNNQNKCDTCHTRHTFSLVEARKPEACATCHNGVDHNNFEAYMLSKHGTVYRTDGGSWNWDVRLRDAVAKGGQTAPTCQSCHMEYKGEYGHNLVRKVRWANYPAVPGIAENIASDWSRQRLEAWVGTCSQCHSGRFARAYLELMDKGTLQGLEKAKEAYAVVERLHKDGLLPGQKTNRPGPPAPEKDGAAQFFHLFWTKANNPTWIEFEASDMINQQLPKLHVGLAHVNPGGWTYTEGWQPLNIRYAKIMDYDTQIRERAALAKKVAALEASTRTSLLDLDRRESKLLVGSLGAGLLLPGGFVLWRSRKPRRP
jgi:hydroxylamine dehydrogenase